MDYLLAQGIESRCERSEEGWTLWILDEDQVEEGRRVLEEFLRNPEGVQYRSAAPKARELRADAARKARRREKSFISVRQRWARGPLRTAPVTHVLIGMCLGVALLTRFGANEAVANIFRIAPVVRDGDMIQWLGLSAIASGEVWRVLSPIFLHFGILHLLFNMYWLYQLGGMVEARRGSVRFTLLVLALGVVSNLAQYWLPMESNPNFGGMSGVLYGLFGFIWMSGRYAPQQGMALPPDVVTILLLFFVLCWTGLLGGIANWAHTAGLVMGMACGAGPHFLGRMLRG